MKKYVRFELKNTAVKLLMEHEIKKQQTYKYNTVGDMLGVSISGKPGLSLGATRWRAGVARFEAERATRPTPETLLLNNFTISRSKV